MMKYTDDSNIVTLFNRKQLRPPLDNASRPESGQVPDTIYFVLPDGTEYPVYPQQDVVIGRQPRQDDPPVTVDLEPFDGHDLGVSRHHCMMKTINDNLVIVDLDSINGTFVNGDRALPTKRYNLVNGDTITVGRLSLEIRFYPRNRR